MRSRTSILLSCFFIDFVSSFVIHDIRQRKVDPPSTTLHDTDIKDDLSTSLDLEPLMALISKYACTKRGREAMLSLFRPHRSSDKIFSVTPQVSKRKTILSNLSSIKTLARDNQRFKIDNTEKIIKIADSLEEVQMEHQFVSSAMSILSDHKNGQSKKSDNTVQSALPPVYTEGTSPWNIGDSADTDDDEWLVSLLSGQFSQDLDFENVLQAEQNVKRTLAIYQWSQLDHTQINYPCFAFLFKDVDITALESVYHEIRDKVKIVKGPRTFNDPSGGKSYEFKLNAAMFPNLSILVAKETYLQNQINDIVGNLMANKKYASQLRGLSSNKPEPYLMDGRVVFTAPKEIAKVIGTIRGHSKGTSYCFVEPKEIVPLGNEIESVKDEINRIENEIKNHLIATLLKNAVALNKGLNAVARIDCIFARAAFGIDFQGVIPVVGSEGIIYVKDFCHPVLASRICEKTVPIDLLVSNKKGERSLIISGPNGGGKSLAMKSFGLCAMMNKLSIPIPQDSSISLDHVPPRIDFFDHILTDFGDHQNILSGESTYMSTLNTLANILERVTESAHLEECNGTPHYLILLDELGGGTEPESGAFIAQAILEQILKNSRTRTVVTTHSNVLKALSLSDDRFNAASVLLRSTESTDKIQHPSFKLCYGIIGNSYALSAASRTRPPLPDDVLNRAASLMSSVKDSGGEYIRRMSEVMERERDSLSVTLQLAKEYKHDMLRCRDALYLLSRSYSEHFSNIENRLDTMIKEMKDKEDHFTLVGDSLATLRLLKEKAKSKEEMLKLKGMRPVTMSDVFKGGESVIIIEGDWKGEMGTISLSQDDVTFDELVVDINFESGLFLSDSNITTKLKRSYLAVWDYPSDEAEWKTNLQENPLPNVRMAKNNLMSVLNNLQKRSELSTKAESKFKNNSESTSSFSSSRERKSAKKKRKSKK